MNKKYIILTVEELGKWLNLPFVGIILQNYKRLENLPFKCTHATLWITLTHQFNPNTSQKISLCQLTPEASIIYKILRTNLNSQDGNRVDPSFSSLVALFCIVKKIQVNWAFLALHNLGTNTKRV